MRLTSPRWVKSTHSRGRDIAARFTPNCGLTKCDAGMALSFQERTLAPQQNSRLFDHLVGALLPSFITRRAKGDFSDRRALEENRGVVVCFVRRPGNA
jgi:hypothetical protein